MAGTQEDEQQSTSKLAMARDYVVESRYEMDKVTWPSKDELVASTRAVVIGSLVLGMAIGLVDKILTLILVNGIANLAR